MKKMIAGIVAAIAITGAACQHGRCHADKDIVDTAVAAGSFKTLAKALQAADLVETLKEPGPSRCLRRPTRRSRSCPQERSTRC